MGPSVLLALIIAAGGTAAAAGESAPFSLTLQGAASLGTYEAAVNWTVIRLIRSNRREERQRPPCRGAVVRGRRRGGEPLRGSESPPRCLAADRPGPAPSGRSRPVHSLGRPVRGVRLHPRRGQRAEPRLLREGASLQAWMPRAGGLHHDPRL